MSGWEYHRWCIYCGRLMPMLGKRSEVCADCNSRMSQEKREMIRRRPRLVLDE